MAVTSSDRGLWRPEDLANHLGIPLQTIYAWRTRGIGPRGIRVGKYLRFRPDDVEAWLDERAAGDAA